MRFTSPLAVLGAAFVTLASTGLVVAQRAAQQADVAAPELTRTVVTKVLDPGRRTFVPGEVLIRYRNGGGLQDASARAIEAERGLARKGFNASLGIHHYALPEGTNVADALRALRDDPRVDFVEPNILYQLHQIPSDGFYDNYNGVASDLQKWVYDANNVNAEAAWNLTTGRSDVVIAIVDSGIDLDHPDLVGNIWTNPGEVPGNGTDDDGNGFIDDVNGWDFESNDNDPNPEFGDGFDNDFNGAPDDNVFHGTFSASCASATANDGGMVGGSWNCQLMAVKVFPDDGGASVVDIANAVTYAANNGADVVNMSLGGGFSSTIQSAVNFAHSQGVVTVASAGNANSSSQQYPASLAFVISVGASDSGSVLGGGSGDIDGRASFSQYGSAAVDVVAPGTDLVGAAMLSVADGNPGAASYFLASGTSFSSPMVAGLAGLVISRARDLGVTLSNDEIETLIQSNTIDLPDDPNDSPNGGSNWDGNGLVDFLACLNAVAPPANQAPVANAGPNQSGLTSDTFTFDGTGSFDPDSDPIVSYDWDFGDGNTDSGSIVTHSYAAAGSYLVTLTVSDGSLTDDDTATVTVSTVPTNQAPVANAGPDQSGLTTDTFTLDGTGSFDPDSDPIVSYDWDFGDGNTDSGSIVAHSYAAGGTYVVTLTVSDGSLTDGDTAVITVNDPPTGGASVYLCSTNLSVPGVGNLVNEDVFVYDTATGNYSWYFDGSDVGLSSAALSALHVLPDGDILMSFTAAFSVPGLTGGPSGTSVDDSDIVRFTPASTGSNTSGVFSFYFDGSDVGLTSNSEDIDALSIDDSGRLVVSTTGRFTGSGASGADEDLFAFNASSLGASTSGSFVILFDGSDVGMGGNSSEDIDAAHVGAGNVVYLSVTGNFSVSGGLTGADEDVFQFTPTSTGSSTSGSFAHFYQAALEGISSSEDIRGVSIDF